MKDYHDCGNPPKVELIHNLPAHCPECQSEDVEKYSNVDWTCNRCGYTALQSLFGFEHVKEFGIIKNGRCLGCGAVVE